MKHRQLITLGFVPQVVKTEYHVLERILVKTVKQNVVLKKTFAEFFVVQGSGSKQINTAACSAIAGCFMLLPLSK